MSKAITFYFDFSSPYGYIAAEVIERFARANGANVAWRPFLLGPVFKETGARPLVEQPLKGPYSGRDIARSAVFYNVPFKMPTRFPMNGLLAARAFYWLAAHDAARAVPFAQAVYRAYFQRDQDITAPEVIGKIAANLGADVAALGAGAQDQAIKDRLRQTCDEAIARGVFGSPFFFIDDEPFWGVDRLPMMEKWLTTGGWKY